MHYTTAQGEWGQNRSTAIGALSVAPNALEFWAKVKGVKPLGGGVAPHAPWGFKNDGNGVMRPATVDEAVRAFLRAQNEKSGQNLIAAGRKGNSIGLDIAHVRAALTQLKAAAIALNADRRLTAAGCERYWVRTIQADTAATFMRVMHEAKVEGTDVSWSERMLAQVAAVTQKISDAPRHMSTNTRKELVAWSQAFQGEMESADIKVNEAARRSIETFAHGITEVGNAGAEVGAKIAAIPGDAAKSFLLPFVVIGGVLVLGLGALYVGFLGFSPGGVAVAGGAGKLIGSFAQLPGVASNIATSGFQTSSALGSAAITGWSPGGAASGVAGAIAG